MSLAHRSVPTLSVRLLALAFGVTAATLAPHAVIAQQAPPAASDAPASSSFSQQDLDQLLAPIALYPDALLAQILMAATYPLEVVEAARWAKSNPSIKGDALTNALQQQNWDPSVKSLVAVPNALQMMNDKLDWTQKLGDAFLGQQQQVMSTVQNLRAKAQAAGNLKDSKEQKVVVEQAPQGGSQTTVIKIEQADPQVVYVPAYNPTVVYGSWWWPAAPPYAWYPPGYVAGTALLSFTAGVIVGNALWGNCDWGRGDVNINVNRYNNFNRTNINNANWRHNVDHRRGVAYRDNATGARFGRNPGRDQQSREAFRGRANENHGDLFSGRHDGDRPGGGGDRMGDRAGDRTGDRTGDRGRDIGDRGHGGGDRPGMGGMSGDRMGDRGGGRQDGGGPRGRSDRQGQGAGGRGEDRAFGDAGQGADARRFSERGSESRAGMRGGGDRGGGGRMGGGDGGGGHFGGGHGRR